MEITVGKNENREKVLLQKEGKEFDLSTEIPDILYNFKYFIWICNYFYIF